MTPLKKIGNCFIQLCYFVIIIVSANQIACDDKGTGPKLLPCDGPRGQWQLLGLEDETITAIAVHPVDQKVIYAGSQFDFSAGWQGKLFKSTDCGKTWKTLLIGGSYRAILLDPLNPDIVYAIPGSLIKSMDAGITWKTVANGIKLDLETRVSCLAIDPQNPNTLYAGTGGFLGGSLYKSNDGGLSWTNLAKSDTLSDGIISLAIDPKNTNVIYAGTADRGYVLKSTDGGMTWDVTGLRETGQLVHSLLVDPENSRTIFAALGWIGMLKTENAGKDWRPYNLGLPDTVNGMKLAKNLHSKELYLVASWGDEGWIYRKISNDSAWTKIGIQGLRRSYYYSDLALAADNSALYFGAKGLYRLKLE